MPELPEVETVRRGLSQLIIGRTVKSVQVIDSPKSFPNTAANVNHFLIHASITAVRRRAKVLLLDVSSEYSLVIHLKMTGQLVFVDEVSEAVEKSVLEHTLQRANPRLRRSTEKDESSNAISSADLSHALVSGDVARFGAGHPNDSLIGKLPDRSTRVVIEFTDGSHLYFNDQRKFGWVKLMPTLEIPNIDFMKKVGPEPLENDFTSREFIPRIRRRNNTTIKAAILDQTVLAGVGNIYADESLWAARIHPAMRVRDISDKNLTELLKEIKFVMNLSIEKGGSTNKNYVNAEGKRGSYMDFANVFRREGQKCMRHPKVEIEKIRVAGRGTHICPVCQLIEQK